MLIVSGAKTKLHIIVTAFNRELQLQQLIINFLIQTNPDWVMHIIHDGPPTESMLNMVNIYTNKYSNILFEFTPKIFGSYGHPNRKYMLDKINTNSNDYILITNDDNYYIPRYVEMILRGGNDRVGLVFYDTIHSHFDYNYHQSYPKETKIDMGAFVVRADIAKKVGFNRIDFSADGHYAEQCARYCKDNNISIIYTRRALFVHN